jgi:hypothetical protein
MRLLTFDELVEEFGLQQAIEVLFRKNRPYPESIIDREYVTEETKEGKQEFYDPIEAIAGSDDWNKGLMGNIRDKLDRWWNDYWEVQYDELREDIEDWIDSTFEEYLNTESLNYNRELAEKEKKNIWEKLRNAVLRDQSYIYYSFPEEFDETEYDYEEGYTIEIPDFIFESMRPIKTYLDCVELNVTEFYNLLINYSVDDLRQDWEDIIPNVKGCTITDGEMKFREGEIQDIGITQEELEQLRKDRQEFQRLAEMRLDQLDELEKERDECLNKLNSLQQQAESPELVEQIKREKEKEKQYYEAEIDKLQRQVEKMEREIGEILDQELEKERIIEIAKSKEYYQEKLDEFKEKIEELGEEVYKYNMENRELQDTIDKRLKELRECKKERDKIQKELEECEDMSEENYNELKDLISKLNKKIEGLEDRIEQQPIKKKEEKTKKETVIERYERAKEKKGRMEELQMRDAIKLLEGRMTGTEYTMKWGEKPPSYEEMEQEIPMEMFLESRLVVELGENIMEKMSKTEQAELIDELGSWREAARRVGKDEWRQFSDEQKRQIIEARMAEEVSKAEEKGEKLPTEFKQFKKQEKWSEAETAQLKEHLHDTLGAVLPTRRDPQESYEDILEYHPLKEWYVADVIEGELFERRMEVLDKEIDKTVGEITRKIMREKAEDLYDLYRDKMAEIKKAEGERKKELINMLVGDLNAKNRQLRKLRWYGHT